MLARLPAQPPDHLHPGIDVVTPDKLPAAQVVIEMDFIPVLAQPIDAIGNRFNPDRLRVLGQEDLRPLRVVVEKQQARRGRDDLLAKNDPG